MGFYYGLGLEVQKVYVITHTNSSFNHMSNVSKFMTFRERERERETEPEGYIQRETQREREREIYIYIYRERDREKTQNDCINVIFPLQSTA